MNPHPDTELLPEESTFGERVVEWFRTRKYLHLLAAFPALAALLALAFALVFLASWDLQRAEANCYETARRAFAGRDFETARVAYEALLRLGGKQRQEYAFRLMLALNQVGRDRDAAALALVLAPPRQVGYAPAHLFVAKTLLAATNEGPARLAAAASHLERVLATEPANTDAHDLLSQIYLQTGKLDQAKRHLLELVASSGDALLRLAYVFAAEKDTATAKQWGERAAKFYRSRLEQAKSDDPAARMGWASSLLVQGDYNGAFELLLRGYKESKHPVYQMPLARLCAEWANHLAQQSPTNLTERFRVVQDGLEFDPANEGLLRQLAALTNLQGEEAERAREIVRQMIVDGRNAALLHFCLGAEAWTAGQQQKAFEHFKLAYELAPDISGVANNMALTLAYQNPPDLNRALAIANSLIQRDNRNATFHDTRGQILMKAGRYREALEDLASALPMISQKAATHRALAECYRQIGMPDLAADHERAALESPTATGTNAPPGDSTAPR